MCFFDDSDSDSELEIFAIAASKEEQLNNERRVGRRFRISQCLFLRILSTVEAYDPYFAQKQDVVGVLGLSSLQKMTAAMRMLAYGVAVDFVDDYVRIRESIAIESLQRFVEVVVAVFSNVYLRTPNKDDIAKLLAMEKNHGFPGMLGRIDCMHWKLKNCPTT
ncbi:uncharacterized protein LOC114292742 [Camellia sinensis]|uniref:uncharacterized protein LOC114292742 n=1 Tax=Camellia sinensis TaxID=4442 RepID=UPI001035E339|nr:uncharacterized protein LOC114292742 [Camellia sinensis]